MFLILERRSSALETESRFNVLPGLAFIEVFMSRSSADPPTVPYTIAGTVTLLGKADNAGAPVTAFRLDRGADLATYTTEADGRYYLFVPSGRYRITVEYGGKSISREIDYPGEGRSIDGVDFTLTVTP